MLYIKRDVSDSLRDEIVVLRYQLNEAENRLKFWSRIAIACTVVCISCAFIAADILLTMAAVSGHW